MPEKPTYEELEKRVHHLENKKTLFSERIHPQPGEESSFAQLFQWAPIPMDYATEKDGYAGTIWNAAWYKTFGYPQSIAQGRSGAQIGLWVQNSDRIRLIEMAKQQNYVTDFECILRCYDDTVRHCSLFGRFIDNPGNRLLMIIYNDITERKQVEKERQILQEQLNQAQKMESIGGLAAGMAHEINNPLAGIMQNVSVMKSRLGKIDMPANVKAARELGLSMEDIRSFMEKRDIFQMIDAIHDSGSRAAEIVNGMLSFARKSNAEFSSHPPDQLMDEILELAATDYDLKKQYDFKSIQIIRHYEENLPLVPCEGPKIQQVLLNILRNGAQAMQTIKTKAPRFIVRICSEKTAGMVRIEIEDNGPGMDTETRSKIFEPFFTTKPVGTGTGLGLSVSYFIVTETHKGKIEVRSEPGKGTNFIIRLPIERKIQDLG